MKTFPLLLLGSSIITALLLTGCSPSEKPAAPASAAANATAAKKPESGRAVAITANDTMKFNRTEIHAKPGEALAVTLLNEGTVPKFSMGHNWVLLHADVDLTAFASDGAMAAATDYIAPADKDKVIAATKLLGPKESDTVLFHAPEKPGRYPFICSFPGHLQVGMKGDLIVE